MQFVEEELTLRTKQSHKRHCTLLASEGISSEERVHYSKMYGVNRYVYKYIDMLSHTKAPAGQAFFKS